MFGNIALATTLAALISFNFALAGMQSGLVILVLGPPGSGKTTNAKRISQQYRIPAISMSGLLKQSGGWNKAGSKKDLRAAVESGDLTNDVVSVELLRQRINKGDTDRGFVLDGFPLTARQAQYLDELTNGRGFKQPIVVHLTLSDSIAEARMLNRGQADDKPEIIQRRLAEYRAQADLVLRRYRQVITVDTSGTPDEVWKTIQRELDGLAK